MSDEEQFEPAEPTPSGRLVPAVVFLLAALGWSAAAIVAAPEWAVVVGCVLASAPCYTVGLLALAARRRR